MTAKKNQSERVGGRTSIFKVKRTWYVNYQEAGRQVRQSLKTNNKVIARQKAGEIELKLQQGGMTSQSSETTVAKLIEEYDQSLVTNHRARKTLVKYRAVLTRFQELLVQEGVTRTSQIRARHLQACRNQRSAAGCQAKTIYNETVILLQLLKFAKRMDFIATEPSKGFPNPEPRPTPQPCWTPEQVDQILAAARDQDRLAFTILADTGLRLGELQWLSWDDIDLEQKILRVCPKEAWEPKTGNQRTIPLTPRLLSMFPAMDRIGRWVIIRPHTVCEDEPRQLNPRRLLVALKRVLGRLGLNGHLHTFRHSFISKALLGGTPEPVVREWAGHVDPAILKLYTHVTTEQSRQFMDRLSACGNAASNVISGGTTHEVHDSESAQIQHTGPKRKKANLTSKG